ncbi:MAG: hydroxymethylglutaryl-CoA lyase [Candidatus Brocadiae bacterium]|nr:hydroxymethylglutaryl-CoA lyase [Candidatus Brocadiia bacterium]
MTLPPSITLVEVGPRDGLQNEPTPVPVEAKVAFIEALMDAGLREIEVTSFVSPKWVPQLADAGDVFARLKPRPGITWSALVPNLRGMERALACGVRKVAVFTGATETFCRKNINMSFAESLDAFRPVVAEARKNGIAVRGYLSTAFGCPYEGAVDPARAAEAAHRLADLGCDELSIGDTIGVAAPTGVEALLSRLAFPRPATALHFHDTRGTAAANAVQAATMGFARFDASAGGAGGCPYAPGAAGNVATEDLVYLFETMGVRTGVDLSKLAAASEALFGILGRTPPGKAQRAAMAAARKP